MGRASNRVRVACIRSMTRVVVTGARGFIGRNLTLALRRRSDVTVTECDLGDEDRLAAAVAACDVVIHLAGVNRPADVQEFRGNLTATDQLVGLAERAPKPPAIAFASSIQAETDNPYGASKRAAEQLILDYGKRTAAPVYVYRITNVFGKWCRPNYNSVVATFCHNIARGLEITISDPERSLELIYIDDVVKALL